MDKQKKIIFIFGSQRSGTSVSLNFLGSPQNVYSFPEVNSPLTDQDTCELPRHTIRLNPLDDVQEKIENIFEKYVIIKPLVESQNAKVIVTHFPHSNALWLYRDYRDCVSSMV